MKHCRTAIRREKEKKKPAPNKWIWRFEEAWKAAVFLCVCLGGGGGGAKRRCEFF